MTNEAFVGPSAAKFWLATLRKTDNTSKRNFLTLAGAAVYLGCQPDDLLDKGLSGDLALYAPVLHEGLYVWPVTERGVPHARLLGNRDSAPSIFQARLNYGDYAMLMPTDIKKIKIEQSVKPRGYICPEWVLHHLDEWDASQHEKRAAALLDRIKRLAGQVAWVQAFPPESEVGIVRLDMLRVDSRDVPSLTELPQKPANTEAAQVEPVDGSQVSATADVTASSRQQSYGKKRMQQIEAIVAGARALGLDPQNISVGKPTEEKKKIREWCKDTRPELFGGGDDPFKDAWAAATETGKIVVINKAKFTT